MPTTLKKKTIVELLWATLPGMEQSRFLMVKHEPKRLEGSLKLQQEEYSDGNRNTHW